MSTYHKINGVFKRETEGPNKGRFRMGDWAQEEFEILADVPWAWTEKVDGTNIRLMVHGNGYQIGGRTDRAQIPVSLIDGIRRDVDDHRVDAWRVQHGLQDVDVVLYGEGYGAGIQKGGGDYRDDQGFVLFDVKVGDTWLDRDKVNEVGADLGVETVQVVFWNWTLRDAVEQFVHGGPTFESAWPGKNNPEGLIGVPVGGLLNRRGERIITKLKFVDF